MNSSDKDGDNALGKSSSKKGRGSKSGHGDGHDSMDRGELMPDEISSAPLTADDIEALTQVIQTHTYRHTNCVHACLYASIHPHTHTTPYVHEYKCSGFEKT